MKEEFQKAVEQKFYLLSPNNCQIQVTQWCRKWREKAWGGMKKKFKQKNGNNGAAQGRIRNEPMTEILGSECGSGILVM
jgi:hypothetical protein